MLYVSTARRMRVEGRPEARQSATILGVSGLVAMILGVATPASSAEPVDVGFTLGLASQYTGKGLGKSDGDPAVSGEVEIEANGFYASVFASTAANSQGADSEIVSSLGYQFEAASVDFDVSLVNRDLPGTRAGVDANYNELQADLSRGFGKVSTRLRINWTEDGYGATREAWWTELQGAYALDSKTKASVALGSRRAHGGADYTAWNAGVKRKLTDNLALDLRWYDTDEHDLGEPYEGRLVAALTLSL